MWACLQDHDTTNHWKQVAGWRKICDLAQTHLSRLREYRRGLAEAWPPATNAAARAYLAELDELIDKVRRTHDAAAANYTALAAATQAISGTRARLKTIHEEYAAKLQQKQAYEATAADPKAAMGSRVPDRPVTDADLEQLNVQARGIMYGLSSELQQAQVTLQRPPAVRSPIQNDNPDVYAGHIQPIPIIPPIVPAPVARHELVSRPSASARLARPEASTLTPSSGPVLGNAGIGGATTPPASTPISPTPGTPASSQPSAPPSAWLPSRLAPSNAPQSHRTASAQNARPPRPTTSTAGSTPTIPRSSAPGGIIGETPGIGYGQQASGNAQPRHVNPIGGVIGGGGAGTGPSGGAGSRPGGGRSSPPMNGQPPLGGTPNPSLVVRRDGMHGPQERSSQGQSTDELSRWDPDYPWETRPGVPPVVEPPAEEGPIDPGPAIGLKR